MNKKIILAIILAILVLIAASWLYLSRQGTEPKGLISQNQEENANMPNIEQKTLDSSSPIYSERDLLFGLDKKVAGTKLYYSDKFGLGFTYFSEDPNFSSEIKESDRIIVSDQSIEVFSKDPKISLEQAIKDRFLEGYDSKDCFVKISETNEQEMSNYVAAVISFPISTDSNGPWWQNADKCPKDYSETNGIRYFLMNKDVPGKFLFVRIGQALAASDGMPLVNGSLFNWTHSIRILE